MTHNEEKFDLSDSRVVYRLCFEFLEMNLELAAKMAKNEITSEEAALSSADLVQWMGWTLGGENPDFIPAKDWSGAPLGRHLRVHFAADLISLEEADREKFEDDETIIIFAMCQFMGEVQEMLGKMDEFEQAKTEAEARTYHELCVRWTELFTNEKFEAVIATS